MSEAFTPTIGIHRDLPDDIYHSVKMASASNLKEIARSPAHCRAKMDEDRKSTPDKDFGTACHSSVLEPNLFRQKYAVADQCAATTGKGGRCTNMGKVRNADGWFCGMHTKGIEFPPQNHIVLTPENFDKAQYIGDSIRRHPAAREIIDAATSKELSAFWRDGASGVMQKMRTDLLIEGAGIIADLKTAQDASPEGFARAVWDYRYDLSAANYMRGLAITYETFQPQSFQLIAMEKFPPYAVGVYELDNSDIFAAMDELDRLLEIWRQCEEDPAKWSRAYSLNVEPLSIPAWARKRQAMKVEAAA